MPKEKKKAKLRASQHSWLYRTRPQKYPLTLYQNAIYRAVDKVDKLFGVNVHVSQYQCFGYPDIKDRDFPLVVFSHFFAGLMLFEMGEVEEDCVSIMPKVHQARTGVAHRLLPSQVYLHRVMILSERDLDEAKVKAKVMQLCKHYGLEMPEVVKLPFSSIEALTDGRVKLRLVQSLPSHATNYEMKL